MISNEVIEAHEYCDDRQSSISGPHDVTIRIKAVGICGSDVHYYKTMRCANFIANKPKVLGHECAGIVQELGTQVQSLAVGDKVALEPGISCQTCNFCKGGRYNLCRGMKFFGSASTHGSLANMVVHPANVFQAT
ncbi:L-idonate 5-dehydrogenase [Arachis hypogaea]|uniref:L-idonate 5-dehydrogenase n=1 Tax=Arachis hypogaea TaxID=3818 RepID=UPI000DED116F|nr:L-idonate 5-dehydrogenase [Arachis hypogaea]